MNATIGLDRNRAHRHTGAALATSLLWRRDGDWCSGGSGLTGGSSRRAAAGMGCPDGRLIAGAIGRHASGQPRCGKSISAVTQYCPVECELVQLVGSEP